MDDLDLSPVARAFSRVVNRAGILRDEAFPTAFERLLMQRATVVQHDVASTQDGRTRFLKDTIEPCSTRQPASLAK